jgi:hypothetical protein
MQGLGLMRPQRFDACALEGGGDVGMQVLGDRRAARATGILGGLHDEPLVGAAGLEQPVPGLDLACDGHRPGLPW